MLYKPTEKNKLNGSRLFFLKLNGCYTPGNNIYTHAHNMFFSLSMILHKSIAGRYRPVRVADGPITARYRFM